MKATPNNGTVISKIREIPIWDQRMLALMDAVVKEKKQGTNAEFLKSIGFNPSNIPQVRAGARSFTHRQFKAACELYNCSMDWFYGFSRIRQRKEEKQSPVAMIREALNLLEVSEKKQKS